MKAAVIGAGPHGKRVIAALHEIPAVKLSAVVDKSEEALQTARVPATVKKYRSAEDLWADGGAELVCITTNGPSHEPLAKAAIEAGSKHVLVEKPMGCSIAECRRMLAKARQLGVRLSVDQSRRHDPMYQWLREKIRSGDWGQPRCIWVQRPGIGLGCLATHSFDLATFLLGGAVRSVTAWVDKPIGKNPRGEEFVDPGGLVIMDMGPDMRAVISQIEDGAGPMAVEIDLTAARIRIDESFGIAEIIERDLSVRPGPGRPPAYSRIELPEGISAKLSMPVMLKGVLTELIGDGPMLCDGVHGLAAIEVLVAAYVSNKSGHVPVSVPCESKENCELWLPIT